MDCAGLHAQGRIIELERIPGKGTSMCALKIPLMPAIIKLRHLTIGFCLIRERHQSEHLPSILRREEGRQLCRQCATRARCTTPRLSVSVCSKCLRAGVFVSLLPHELWPPTSTVDAKTVAAIFGLLLRVFFFLLVISSITHLFRHTPQIETHLSATLETK